jgi:fatty-acyl-CoA synthase
MPIDVAAASPAPAPVWKERRQDQRLSASFAQAKNSSGGAVAVSAAPLERAGISTSSGLPPSTSTLTWRALRTTRLPYLRTVVAVSGEAPAGVFSLPEFLAQGASVDAAALGAQQAVTPQDVCYILYTSGSTAAPKGVTLAHGPVIANGFDIGERIGSIW